MRFLRATLLISMLALAACGQSNPPPAPSPAVSTAPAPNTAPAPSTAPQPSTAPAATSAASAGTTAAPGAATIEGPEVAGGVSLAEGSVTDTATDGSKRQLKDGDEVYPGDSLVLGDDSYLDIDFSDGGRVLLHPDSTFQIQQYHFEPEAHPDAGGAPAIEIAPAKPENAFFSLVKGGLRAIDGLIGHENPQNYGVETPVATIGVRGTAFDVRYCGDDCKDEADTSGAPENGLYTTVSEGSIGVKNDAGETVTPAGHSGFVKSRKERQLALATPPKALRHMALPEKFKARDEKNRGAVKARQLQRRRRRVQLIQQRKAQEKLHPGAAAKQKGKETPAERREQKQEERKAMTPAERRQERQEKMQERRGEKAPGAGTQLRPQGGGTMTPAERRQERREERQAGQKPGNAAANKPAEGKPSERAGKRKQAEQQKAEQQQTQPQKPAGAPPPKAEPVKKDQSGKDDCKGKKKKKGKDKDKCGGD
jgi:hypothetical protein